MYVQEKLSKKSRIIGKDSNAEPPRNKKNQPTKIEQIHVCRTERRKITVQNGEERKSPLAHGIATERGTFAGAHNRKGKDTRPGE